MSTTVAAARQPTSDEAEMRRSRLWVSIFAPTKRSLGEGVRTWGWSYPLFDLLVTSLNGALRYLLLAFPLGLPLAGPRDARPTQARMALLVVACVALQAPPVVWIKCVFVV